MWLLSNPGRVEMINGRIYTKSLSDTKFGKMHIMKLQRNQVDNVPKCFIFIYIIKIIL